MRQFAVVFNNFVTGGSEKLFINIANKCHSSVFHLYVLRNNIDYSIVQQLPKNIIIIKCNC